MFYVLNALHFIASFIWLQAFFFFFFECLAQILNLWYQVTFTGKLTLHTFVVSFAACLYRIILVLILDKHMD